MRYVLGSLITHLRVARSIPNLSTPLQISAAENIVTGMADAQCVSQPRNRQRPPWFVRVTAARREQVSLVSRRSTGIAAVYIGRCMLRRPFIFGTILNERLWASL